MRKKPELLAPAGTMEKLKMALLYGADAAYLGGKAFGLRAFGGNFGEEELKEAVDFAHSLHKRIYVTVNIFPHNRDIAALPKYLTYLDKIGVDALLISDLGLFMMCREWIPNMELHISTQANNTNWRTVQAWQALGASRVVLARELSFSEIKEIRKRVSVALEMFVHGAMCISYSGRCLLSSYLTGRDANHGACAQICRWKFHLLEDKTPGEYFPIAEDARGTYILNSRDLCLLSHIPELCSLGIDSLKIEGRMKSVHYVASVVKVYREAIDACFDHPEDFQVKETWREELEKVSHRPYTTAFWDGKPRAESQVYETSSYVQTSEFIGLVLAYDEKTGFATVEQRNKMRLGQEIEIFQPKGELLHQRLEVMEDEEGQAIDAAPHAQQIIRIKMDAPVMPYAILRRAMS